VAFLGQDPVRSKIIVDNKCLQQVRILNIMVVQGDQKVSVHLIITTQKVTSNIQSVSRQSPGIY
jgi:hypothetical protein